MVPATTTVSNVDVEKEVEERVRKLRQADEERMQSKQSMTEQLENELKLENKRLNELLQQRAQQWNEEKDNLWKRLHEQEVKNATLAAELSSSHSRAQNVTPQQAQFALMEQQLSALEARLVRREKELMGAMEEGKVAARIEAARLQSMHAQELRERDEQLLRFQREMEGLVQALRQWQHSGVAIVS